MTNKTITSKEIKIPAYDGDAFGAYIAMPEDAKTDNKYPALILIQEIFGINQEMREKCDEYAAKGFVVMCPDLFWRIEPNIQLVDSKPEELEKAFDLFGKFSTEQGMEDLKTTLGYARNMNEANKKVGAIGYCLGGKLAYMISAVSDIDASVSYYGVNIETMTDLGSKVTTPLLMHIAAEDEYVDKDAQEKITNALSDNPNITIHIYDDVNHAFARGKGMHYDEAAATLANTRTTDFLKSNLS